MYIDLLIPSLLLLIAVWPMGLVLSLYSKLRFVDAYSHMLLPVLLLLYVLFASKWLALYIIFPIFVWFVWRLFKTESIKTNLDVVFMGLSALGLNFAIVLMNLFPKNWHLDSDILLFGNFDIFVLNKIQFVGLNFPVIYLILAGLLFLNYCLYCLHFRKLHYLLIKGDRRIPNINIFSLSLVLLINLFVLFYLLGPFLLLGVLALPFAIAEVYSKNFSKFLELSFLLPSILLGVCFPFILDFDFSLSQFLVSLLFFFWLISFFGKLILTKVFD